ncbi:glycoside hydrolase superfamily [Xylariaceae sp. FL0016]|nr:glycoside hydrolase superfamily [Xylariaceae sp. FL0016]
MNMRLLLRCALGTLGLTLARGAYDAGVQSNIAVYWGQNSINQVGAQKSLLSYCQSETNIDIIPIAFLTSPDPTKVLESLSSGIETIESDITACQSQHGKTIMLSLGGDRAFGWAFAAPADAEKAATDIFQAFGPADSAAGAGATRPFGSASIDGFDLDFEGAYPNIEAFARKLRQLMDGSGRTMYLSAAPQCPLPEVNLGTILGAHAGDVVDLDFVFVQFYNNPSCDVRAWMNPNPGPGVSVNIDQWDNWAAKQSKIFLGLPAGPTAANGHINTPADYVDGNDLARLIDHCKGFESFGGVMMWDMTQQEQNAGFMADTASALGKGAPQPISSPISSDAPVPSSTAARGTVASSSAPDVPVFPSAFASSAVAVTPVIAGDGAGATTTTTTAAGSMSAVADPEYWVTETATQTRTETVSGSPSDTGALGEWDPCGGVGYQGSGACGDGLTCASVGRYWSFCQTAST